MTANRTSHFKADPTGLAHSIIRHKKPVAVFFAVAALLCTLLSLFVSVNYNITDYLPQNAPSTKALAVLEAEFTQSVPNGRVMLRQVSIQETLAFKEKLARVEGVVSVIWLDDLIDVRKPLELADPDTVRSYFKNGDALLSVTIADGYESDAVAAIRRLIGEGNAISGQAADVATLKSMASGESTRAFLVLLPVVILILLLTTSSWIEPLFFLVSIGVSIIINMGTNALLGEISFVTLSVSPILQMAVSLDYAIFLLHSFEEFRQQSGNAGEAMAMAMKRSFPAIAASAATTLFGFAALLFMKFKIGSDLGLSLAKGILCSFLSVMVFLPAVTLLFYRWIDKTRHRRIIPELKGIGKGILKLRYLALLLVLLVIVPAFLAQRNNDYIYGMGSNLSDSSRSGRDNRLILDTFGESTVVVLLVPAGDMAKEALLCEELKTTGHVIQVVAYPTIVGKAVPVEFPDDRILAQFHSERYARIIVYTDTESEGPEAFAAVEAIQAAAGRYYGNDFLSCGQSVNLYDMKNVVESDSLIVNLIAILAILAVLLVTLKSVTLPLVLIVTIETAIWINLSVPYLTGEPLCYIGYLIISTVQLGATVDYAILLTDRFKEHRRHLPAREAVSAALGETSMSIFTSGAILSSAGFCLAIISSDRIVSEMGLLIGRGALLSVLMVTLFLPAVLLLIEKSVPLTSLTKNKAGDS